MTLTRSAGILAFYCNLWHFGIFAKKSDRKLDPIFPIFRFYPIFYPFLSDFFPIFRLFPTFILPDSTTLLQTRAALAPCQVDGQRGRRVQRLHRRAEERPCALAHHRRLAPRGRWRSDGQVLHDRHDERPREQPQRAVPLLPWRVRDERDGSTGSQQNISCFQWSVSTAESVEPQKQLIFREAFKTT